MKNMRLFIVVFSFLFLSAFAAQASAQIAGGYNKTDAKSADVRSAAAFAVTREARKERRNLRLVSITQVERQVVAGTNYKICLRVREGRNTRSATIVVYQNLRQKYRSQPGIGANAHCENQA